MTTYLSSQARDVLQQIHYIAAVNRLFLTCEELDEKVYREVKEVCTRLGGRWNTASQSFVFSSDPTEALAWVCERGEMPLRNPYAFFQSPDTVTEDMIMYGFGLFRCNLCEGYRHNQPLHCCQYLPANLRILEPSAGQGVCPTGSLPSIRRPSFLVLHPKARSGCWTILLCAFEYDWQFTSRDTLYKLEWLSR